MIDVSFVDPRSGLLRREQLHSRVVRTSHTPFVTVVVAWRYRRTLIAPWLGPKITIARYRFAGERWWLTHYVTLRAEEIAQSLAVADLVAEGSAPKRSEVRLEGETGSQ